MITRSDVLVVGALAALATSGLAVAQAKDSVESRTELRAAAPAESAERVQTSRVAEVPKCGRKVKVVYAGYGEGGRPGCPTAAQ